MFEPPGLLGRPYPDPRRQGLLALAGRLDADAKAWRRRLLRERWRRQRGEEKARERYRKGLIGTFDTGDAEGLLSGASEAVTAPPGGAGFDLGNIGRGIGERAGDLGGGLLGAVNAAADYLERQVPLGGIDLERGGLYGPEAPPERNLGHVAARRLRNLDLGYTPGTSWEEVKRSPAAKAIPFALEQGLVSVPDMAAALINLPAYVLARTGELAGARAEADLREEATVGDLVAALPGAAASALLERLGARGILGIGDAFKPRSPRGVAGAATRGSAKEGGTEMGQDGIEHLTTRLGTATGIDGREMADSMMAGGVTGLLFGGGMRGATATGEALLGRPQIRKSSAGAPRAPSVPSAPAWAEPPGTPAAVSSERPETAGSSGIRRVIVAARQRGHSHVKETIGRVSAWFRNAAAKQGLALDGYTATVDTSSVRHVMHEHGDAVIEAARGQVPITEADLEALPHVLATAEKIVFGLKNRRDQDEVVFLKVLPDGSTLIVTEVRTGRHELALASIRKYPGTMNIGNVLSTLDPNARSDTGDGISIVDRPADVTLLDDVARPESSPANTITSGAATR